MIAEPPVLAGADQERSIAVLPLDVAERLVGAPGAVAAPVVASATLEEVLVPMPLMAETR